MNEAFYKNLHAEGLLSDESFGKITPPRPPADFSVQWEVRGLLYTGVLLLTGGLGLLVYENIDTIGHKIVLVCIAAIFVACFAYCYKTSLPFSPQKVKAPNTYSDYVLLLGSVSMVSFIGYWQYQYHIFGTSYGLATFIPMVVLFFIAYYFDHLGILSMAIANLAIWMGVSVTPKALLLQNDYDSGTIINIYIVLAVLLIIAAFLSQHYNFKKHFKFTYLHYGVHVGYIALLAGYFHYYDNFLAAIYLAALVLLSGLVYIDAIKNKSFYFLLLMTIYSYIALSSLVIRVLFQVGDIGAVYLVLLYFIGSAVGLIFLLISFNKKLKAL